jgi:hypothetical protein
MKEKKKAKGGKRAGAGRKPGKQKEAVTVYTDTSKFGGKDKTRTAIYGFLDGNVDMNDKVTIAPHPGVFDSSKVDLSKFEDEVRFPVPKNRVKDLTKPTNILKPQEQPKSNFVVNIAPVENKAEILAQIAELEKELKSPPKNPIVGLTIWKRVREEQLQSLKNQLK